MMIECFKVLFWLFEFSFVCDIKWKIRKKPIAATSLSQLWTKTIKEKKTNTFLPKLQGYSEKETVSCVLPLPDWIRCHQHHHQIPPIFSQLSGLKQSHGYYHHFCALQFKCLFIFLWRTRWFFVSIRQATISFHDAAVCSDSSPGDGVDCRLSVIEQNQKTNAQKKGTSYSKREGWRRSGRRKRRWREGKTKWEEIKQKL